MIKMLIICFLILYETYIYKNIFQIELYDKLNLVQTTDNEGNEITLFKSTDYRFEPYLVSIYSFDKKDNESFDFILNSAMKESSYPNMTIFHRDTLTVKDLTRFKVCSTNKKNKLYFEKYFFVYKNSLSVVEFISSDSKYRRDQILQFHKIINSIYFYEK